MIKYTFATGTAIKRISDNEVVQVFPLFPYTVFITFRRAFFFRLFRLCNSACAIFFLPLRRDQKISPSSQIYISLLCTNQEFSTTWPPFCSRHPFSFKSIIPLPLNLTEKQFSFEKFPFSRNQWNALRPFRQCLYL